MAEPNLFYQYYDVLFEDKDYVSEVDAIIKMYDHYQKKPLEKVLEIGCGTGNHTLEIGRRKIAVTATDIDPQMLKIARNKIGAACMMNISVTNGLTEAFLTKDCDLVVALFNVITYIPEKKYLESFFTDINHLSRSGTLFIFDCWNGKAVYKDPPAQKTFEKAVGEKKIICNLTSHTDFQQKQTTLNYFLTLLGKDGKKLESDQFSFNQSLWQPEDIKAVLQAKGFELLDICKLYSFDKADCENDWKIMFIVRKASEC